MDPPNNRCRGIYFRLCLHVDGCLSMLTPTKDGLLPSMAILAWARRDSDYPAVIEDRGRTWTWRMIANAANQTARALDGTASRPVAFSAPNGGAFAAIMMGIWLAGAVPAPVSPRLPGAERDRVLASIDPARTIVTAELGLAADVIIDVDDLAIARLDDGLMPELPRVDPQAPGIVICTSGTTGSPKPVVHTKRGIWGFIDGVARKPIDPDAPRPASSGGPVRVDSRPMNHAGAIYGLLSTLWRGRPLVVMSRFEPVRYAELVRKWDIETLNLVPTMVRMLLDAGDEVGALAPPATLCTSGTAPLPDSWREEFEARFGVPVQRNYGSTEVSTVAVEPLEDALSGNRRVGAAGKISRGVQVQIRDEDNQPVRTGDTGSIWVRSETLRPRVIGEGSVTDADGWIDTGDIGRIDADDYVYVTSRKRELIIRGGLKIVPAEIEAELMLHPAVLEAAVAGIPDERLGEVPAAWVRLTEAATEDHLRAHVRSQLAAYKVPVAVYFVDDFPRTDSGKVRKRDLVAGLTEPSTVESR